MYTSPTLTKANIKLIIMNTIITIRLRFQLEEMLRYNFGCSTNFSMRAKIETPCSIKYNIEKILSK